MNLEESSANRHALLWQNTSAQRDVYRCRTTVQWQRVLGILQQRQALSRRVQGEILVRLAIELRIANLAIRLHALRTKDASESTDSIVCGQRK